ncbi:MAG: tetratricopeptide repeat protein, partial [Pseudomonadota bacterium]
MTEAYPKKYWWLVLVAVPIILALLALLPTLLPNGGDSNGTSSRGHQISIAGSTVGGDVQIVGSQVIYQQLANSSEDKDELTETEASVERAYNLLSAGFYAEALPLFDKLAERLQTADAYNNAGALYLATNQSEQAEAAFREGLAIEPDSDALRLNLAQLYEKQGQLDKARAQLEKVGDQTRASARLQHLEKMSASGAMEQEPNNDILQPNLLPLSNTVGARIDSSADVDYFQITSGPPPRDILSVELENLGTDLAPQLRLWSADKQHVWAGSQYPTPGQDASYRFSAEDDTVYFVSVHSQGGEGQYQLQVRPLLAFDSFEPNDTILQAAPIELNRPIGAALMDQRDVDFFKLDSPVPALEVTLTNLSAELAPQVQLWDANKRRLHSSSQYPTTGQ